MKRLSAIVAVLVFIACLASTSIFPTLNGARSGSIPDLLVFWYVASVLALCVLILAGTVINRTSEETPREGNDNDN